MPRRAKQLTLPIFGDAIPNALLEVIADPKEKRLRVRPLDFSGWVKFPKHLRIVGARYIVELLKPRGGGSWTATGSIRKVS